MRAHLSLYQFNRPLLKQFSEDLKSILLRDDRKALSEFLGLGAALEERLSRTERAVDWFLRPETDPEATPFFASLRRVAKKCALEQVWTSTAASLEGRLRHYDMLREEKTAASLIDKLLDSNRMPWYLKRPGATSGWLHAADRERLSELLSGLRAALPPELAEFSDGLDTVDGDVIAHDML